MHDQTDEDSGRPAGTATDDGIDRDGAEAERSFGRAEEHPGAGRQELERIVDVLTARQGTGREDREHRVAASSVLASTARVDSAALEAFLPAVVEALRRETEPAVTDGPPENQAKAGTVRANLVETVSNVIVETSGTAVGKESFTDFVAAVTTDLEAETLRLATQALFASADHRAGELASAVTLLDELLTYPDDGVQAWAAGTVGRVAATHPNAVADTAVDLRRLLSHEDGTVQHNSLEALAAFVGTRPDVVVPAAGTLRDLLEHEEVAIRHNAAGILYVLAEHQPGAVRPAAGELRTLRDHHNDAIGRIATATLARLAREREGAATDSNHENG